MKILLVASYFPFPLHSGGQVRLYNLLRNLGKKHEITLVCETRGEVVKSNWDRVQKYCRKILTVTRPKQWSITNIFKTGFSLYPFLLMGHQNEQMKKIISEQLGKNRYSLIHVETFYVMHNLPASVNIPVVLTEHNIEWKIYKKWADRFWFWPLKPLLYLDVLKMKLWEKHFWQKADRIVAVSDLDQQIIEKETGKPVEVIPNGVDCDYFGEIAKVEPEIPTVVFVGSFAWLQNRDAAFYLVKKLWPKIKERRENAKLWIVGNYVRKYIKDLADEQIVVEEGVDDIREVYSKATLLLAPLRVGGGTKFKILESMASGLPVVTTPKGIEGLGTETNGIIVAKTEEELVERTVSLLNDKIRREEIAHKEKRFVRRNFDWGDISRKLERVYFKVAPYENSN